MEEEEESALSLSSVPLHSRQKQDQISHIHVLRPAHLEPPYPVWPRWDTGPIPSIPPPQVLQQVRGRTSSSCSHGSVGANSPACCWWQGQKCVCWGTSPLPTKFGLLFSIIFIFWASEGPWQAVWLLSPKELSLVKLPGMGEEQLFSPVRVWVEEMCLFSIMTWLSFHTRSASLIWNQIQRSQV